MTFEHITPEWIRNKLKENKLKQVDLAQALDTDRHTVSRWLGENSTIGNTAKAAIFYFLEHWECRKNQANLTEMLNKALKENPPKP